MASPSFGISIAAPVFDRRGAVVASLGTIAPAAQWTIKRGGLFGSVVAELARTISFSTSFRSANNGILGNPSHRFGRPGCAFFWNVGCGLDVEQAEYVAESTNRFVAPLFGSDSFGKGQIILVNDLVTLTATVVISTF